MADSLIVYGVNCVWWDDISKTANSGPGRKGIPLCPHCRSVLFQQDPANWWRDVDRHEANGHNGYRAFVEWQRGRCFRTFQEAQAAYQRR